MPVGAFEFHLRQFPNIGSDCGSFELDDDEKSPNHGRVHDPGNGGAIRIIALVIEKINWLCDFAAYKVMPQR